MISIQRPLVVVACLLALAAAGRPQAAESLPEFAKARDVARQVLDESRALLTKELAARGAAGALSACAAVAVDIAKKREAEGWRIRRVSERIRNPQDEPDAFERRVLAQFAAGPLKPDTEYATILDEHGRRYLRYMKPIVIPGELCLRCHGDPATMEPKVREALRSLYPGDKATGYKVGDLRGAVSVRIPILQ